MCEHVYNNIGSVLCPSCGQPTNEVDWKLAKEQQAEHREVHGYFHNVRGWWSI